MWEVEVTTYNGFDDRTLLCNYFTDKSNALEFCNKFKNDNCDIFLTELIPINDEEFDDGPCICIQEAAY